MVNSTESSSNPIVLSRWLRLGNALCSAVISIPYAIGAIGALVVVVGAALLVLAFAVGLVVFGAAWALAVFCALVLPVLAVGAFLSREKRVALGLWLRDQVRTAAEGPPWWRRLAQRAEAAGRRNIMSWLFHRNPLTMPHKYDFHVADNAPDPHVSIDLVLDDGDVQPVISVPLRQDAAPPGTVVERCERIAAELSKHGVPVADGLGLLQRPRHLLHATLLTQNREIFL